MRKSTLGVYEKVKAKARVLVSSKSAIHLFTQLPTGHRTCSFITYLNSQGAHNMAAISWHRNYSNTSLACSTRYPLIVLG